MRYSKPKIDAHITGKGWMVECMANQPEYLQYTRSHTCTRANRNFYLLISKRPPNITNKYFCLNKHRKDFLFSLFLFYNSSLFNNFGQNIHFPLFSIFFSFPSQNVLLMINLTCSYVILIRQCFHEIQCICIARKSFKFLLSRNVSFFPQSKNTNGCLLKVREDIGSWFLFLVLNVSWSGNTLITQYNTACLGET